MKLPVPTLLAVFLMPMFAACSAEPELPAGAKKFPDLAYAKEPHFRQKLDLYVPEKPAGPLLVYIHGGGWVGGSKDKVVGLQFLAMGYCVASVEYRFSHDAIFPAQIQDCKSAIRYLRAHAAEYGYAPDKIGVFGDSAGGHLTALLATTGQTRDFDVGENLDQSSAIQCGIDFYGPTDFLGFKPPTDNAGIQPDRGDSVISALFGGLMKDHQDLARQASPLFWASKTTAPLFILHGTKDPIVGVEQSERLAEKLKAEGAEVILDVIEGAEHGGAQFFTDGRPQRYIEFYKKYLGK